MREAVESRPWSVDLQRFTSGDVKGCRVARAEWSHHTPRTERYQRPSAGGHRAIAVDELRAGAVNARRPRGYARAERSEAQRSALMAPEHSSTLERAMDGSCLRTKRPLPAIVNHAARRHSPCAQRCSRHGSGECSALRNVVMTVGAAMRDQAENL